MQLGRRRCGGSPAPQGLAGLGVTGLSAARLRAGITADALSALPADGPSRAPGPGQVWRPGGPGAAPANAAQLTRIIRPVACSRPAGGVRAGPPSAGATGCHCGDSDAGQTGSSYTAITVRVTVPVQVTAFGLRSSMTMLTRREPAIGPGPLPLCHRGRCKRPALKTLQTDPEV